MSWKVKVIYAFYEFSLLSAGLCCCEASKVCAETFGEFGQTSDEDGNCAAKSN